MKIEQRSGAARYRRLLYCCAWLCVSLVAGYDTYFAWTYREALPSWELNPLARWGVQQGGLLAILTFKFAGLMFVATLIWHCRQRRMVLARALTIFVVGVHGLLALHYVAGHQQPTEYELACRSAAARLLK